MHSCYCSEHAMGTGTQKQRSSGLQFSSTIYRWNLSNTDTLETKITVLISELSLFQGEKPYVAVPDRNGILFHHVFRVHHRWASAEGGAHRRFIDISDIHAFTHHVWARPQWKLSAIARQTQWCTQNAQQNNIQFLFVTATYKVGSQSSVPINQMSLFIYLFTSEVSLREFHCICVVSSTMWC